MKKHALKGVKNFSAFSAILASLLGCAQKSTHLENTTFIAPVSDEESRLLRSRLEAGVIRPYEQSDIGSGNVSAPAAPTTAKSPIFLETPPTELIALLESVHQSSSDFFRNNPGDLAIYTKIQNGISEQLCFSDHKDKFCGPGLLVGAVFLLDPSHWKTLHEWLGAIEKAMIVADLHSAAFENFVRNFDYGFYSRLELTLKSILNRPACTEALKQLEVAGENPHAWEINLCDLVFAHKIEKPVQPGRI